MKEQIFISYKRVDKERVFAIKDFIEQNTGAKCWIDLDGIESNAQFADKIGTAIDNCQVFIFMRSNAHNTITNLAKDWTYREVNYALDEDKNIVVINLDQSPMPKWFKMLFPNKQEIDATNSDMLNRLCDDLCSWLGILKPAAEQDSESQKKAKQNALPKVPFLVGNLTYKASEHGGVSVCGCDKSLEEVHIPAKVEYHGYTYDVDSIREYAFSGCSRLTSITIPNSVTSIGAFAFYECSGLSSIAIPDSVTSIGEFTFGKCSALSSISIPNSVISIGDKAFSDCESLTSITIPNSVTSIGEYAFAFCFSLKSITISEGVASIGEYAFKWCDSLSSITIPDSVTSIGDRAFTWCSGLTSIIVGKGNEKYDSRENCNAIIETATNTLIRGCENTIIPNSVTSIGDSAFDGCSGLTTITIPNSVISIGPYAFSGCKRLTSILIPDSVTNIGDSAFMWCESLTSISIPDSVTSIGDSVFNGCSSLKKISISKKLINIGRDAIPEHTRVSERGNWSFLLPHNR